MTRKTGGEVARGSRRWGLWVGGAAVAAFLVWGVLRVAGGGDEVDTGEASETGDACHEGAPADAEDYPPAAPPAARLYPEVLSVGSAVLHQGVWFALDHRDARIHRIGSDGTHLGSFGGRGEGPGELRRNIGPIAMHGDSIAVLDRWGVHLYQFDGTPVADWRVEDDHCFAPAIVDMASSPSGLLFVARCSESAGTEPRPRVVLAEGRGPARTLVTDTADVTEVRWDRGFPRMAAHPRGFVFGYTGDECLGLFDLEGAPLERICHDWMDRVPFPEDEADAYMNDVGARARSQGLRVHRPESYPPFIEFSVAGGERLVYLASISQESSRGVRLLTRGPGGRQVVLPIPEGANLGVSGGSVLAAWNDLEGIRIQFYSLDLERGAAEPFFTELPRQ
ncbi:MAG: hypothetical protein OXF01_13370 [Gemmatimonadetes bacterium]|nr:hypothetical protein [Gemmatimonadota bacterium]